MRGLGVLRTPRLILRPFASEDVDALHALWIDPSVRQYLWDDVVISRSVAQQVFDSHLANVERHGIGYWGVYVAQGSSAVAGFCGFRFVGEGPEIELMYGLRGEYWGKGLATEACGAALNHLWLTTGFQRVYARTDPPNQRSVAVMQRLGLTHVSTTKTMISYVLDRPGIADSKFSRKSARLAI
ncbi:MAG TPA: GNAT family N-acetyltransferase [Bryobacteraceae bacterium]|nr:GNAT family N-acetyltransferase [Bryobacteraceae bacterium]